ncbi:MAG: PAS domain S-box protein [bacterium]
MKKTVMKRKPTKKQVKKKPVDKNQLLETILKTTLDGFWLVDLQGRFLKVNDAYCRMIGYSQKELLTMTVLDVEASESAKATAAHIKKAIAKGEDRFQSRHKRKDGCIIDVEISVQYQQVEGGRFVVFGRDITEHKKIEGALRLSEEKFAKAFRASPAIITITQVNDGRILEVSDSFVRIMGYEQEEAVGHTSHELGLWAYPEERERMVPLLLADGCLREQEIHLRNKTGDVLACLYSADLIELGGKKCSLAMIQDITERMKAAEELKASEEKYHSLFRNATIGIFHTTFEGRFIDANPALAKLLGYESPEEVVGSITNIAEQVYADPRQRDFVRSAALEAGGVVITENRYRRKDGTFWHGRLHLRIIEARNGSPRCYEGFVEDITERKKAEKALQASEAMLRSVFASSPDAITVVDLQGKITFCNEATVVVHGASSQSQLIGKNFLDLIAEEDRQRAAVGMKEVFNVGMMRDVPFIGRKGESEVFDGELTVGVMKDDSGKPIGFVGVSKDVTRRKEAKDEKARLLAIIHESEDFIGVADMQGKIIFLNRAANRMIGLPEGVDLSHMKISDMHPDWAVKLIEGEALPVALKAGTWRGEIAVLHGNGTEVPVSQVIVVHKDLNGTPLFISTIMRDISERKKAEAELLRITTAVESASDAIGISDAQGRHLYQNKALSDLFEYVTAEELQANGGGQAVVKDPNVAKEMFTTIMSGKTWLGELEMVKKSGRVFSAYERADAIMDSKGNVVGLIGVIRDITERKKVEATLRESEYFFRESQKAASIGSYRTDFTIGQWESSEVLDQIFGIDREYNRSVQGWLEIVHPDDRDMMGRYLAEEVISKRQPFSKEYRIIRKSDGAVRWVNGQGKADFDASGNALSLIGTIQDISDRKKTEAALLVANKRYRDLFEQANEGLLIMSPDGEITEVNNAFAEMHGYTVAELKTMDINTLDVLKENALKDRADIIRRVTAGEAVRFEVEHVHKDGHIFPLAVTTSMVILDGKSFYLAFHQDITERKKADGIARNSRHRSELQRIAIAQLAIDDSLATADMSLAMQRLTEMAAAGGEVDRASIWLLSEDNNSLRCIDLYDRNAKKHSEGMSLAGADHPQYFDAIRTDSRVSASDALTDRRTSEFAANYLIPLGITSMLDAGIVVDAKLIGVVCLEHCGNQRAWHSDEEAFASTIASLAAQTMTNIKRKMAEGALREKDADLREAQRLAKIGSWRLNVATNQVVWSEELYRMYGADPSLPPPLYTESMKLFTPESWERLAAAIANTIETKVPYELELTTVKKDGSSGWMWASGLVEVDSEGKVVMVRGATQDITESKKAEKELRTKSTELERFLYTASHDLKTPVVTIRSFMRCLKEDIAASDSGKIEKDLKFLSSAADKMVHLLDDLLDMSRVGRLIGTSSHVTVKDLVNDVVNTVAGRISDRGVDVKVADMDVSLYGDRPRLAEIWQNLIENACKLMGDQKNPRIDIGLEHRDKEAVFYVRDNGIGIEPRHHDRVFDLFERLDKHIEGTGVGLAIVKRIVELYQGRIWVESAGLGQGTTFCFTLSGAIKTEGKA